MNSRTRLLIGGSVGVVVIAIAIGVVSANSNSGSDSSNANSGTPTTAAGSSGSGTTGTGNSPTTGSAGGSGTTAAGGSPTTIGKDTPPPKQRGVVTIDTSSKYGQSPSSGTCAHWSERFINNSSVKVVQVTFAPESAFFSKGKKGTGEYARTPAKAPEPATLNVAIDPKQSQALQFMVCTDTTPPAGSSLNITTPAVLRWKWVDGATGTNPI